MNTGGIHVIKLLTYPIYVLYSFIFINFFNESCNIYFWFSHVFVIVFFFFFFFFLPPRPYVGISGAGVKPMPHSSNQSHSSERMQEPQPTRPSENSLSYINLIIRLAKETTRCVVRPPTMPVLLLSVHPLPDQCQLQLCPIYS